MGHEERGWLKEKRLDQGLTQVQVSKQAGISQSAYANIESGRCGVSIESAKRIAATLGFSWTQFYE